LKIIPKKKVKGNEESVWGEMDVLKGLDHPNIVRYLEISNPNRYSKKFRSNSTNGLRPGPSIIYPSSLQLEGNYLNGFSRRGNSPKKMRSPLSGTCPNKHAQSGCVLNETSRSTLEGVRYLHEHDIVHRDLKYVYTRVLTL
jgi:calcium/calmodulin-dependent protein kinase I